MFERIAAQASLPEFKGTSLPPSFNTWIRLSFLHLWLVDVRFRTLPDVWTRNRMLRRVIDYLWEDIEQGLVESLGSRNPLVLSKYSKLLVQQWFGAAMSFDVASITSDASLVDALWRNVYCSDSNVPMPELAALARYVRREQRALADTPDKNFLEGDFSFGRPPFQVPESEKVSLRARAESDEDSLGTVLQRQYSSILDRSGGTSASGTRSQKAQSNDAEGEKKGETVP